MLRTKSKYIMALRSRIIQRKRQQPVLERIISFLSSSGAARQDPVTISTPLEKVWVTVSTVTVLVVKRTLLLILLMILIPTFIAPSSWKGVFMLSCVAVSFDSLFLYIPIIDQQNQCLDSDRRVRNAALVLRSLTDAAFIRHIYLLVTNEMDLGRRKWDDGASKDPVAASWLPEKLKLVVDVIAKKMPWLSIYLIVNCLAILPVPQVAVVFGVFNMGGSEHFLKQTIINGFLVFQCSLRVSQIFLSIQNVGETVGKWVKASFYFFMYIIASHVLAAFWYFFSIQREIHCWDRACGTVAGCMHVFYCNHRLLINSTLLHKLCPIDIRNDTLFNFGIFLDILQSGNTGHEKFSTKILYCFWWGLKNLSNFGTNLETSSYTWENCFAILIGVIGLLLFILLIGNVQTYIQLETEKSVTIEESRRKKIHTKHDDIEKWMSGHNVHDDQKDRIRKYIKDVKLVKVIDEDVDLEFIYWCCGNWEMRQRLLASVYRNALKKIPVLQDMDEQDLKMICFDDGRPSYFPKEKNSHIIKADQRLDAMYFIIDGEIECKDAETTGSLRTRNPTTRRRRDYVGEEVLYWAILNYKSSPLGQDYPLSTVDVICQTNIIAFKITAIKLVEILNKLKNSKPLEELTQVSKIERRIVDWLLRNGFPEYLGQSIMEYLDEHRSLLEENTNANVDVDFLLSILPEHIKPSIKHHLGMIALKRVPMLQKMHEYVLESICNHLEPVVYKMESCIVSAGEPLRNMIFILQGKVILTGTSRSNTTTTSSSEIKKNSSEITETCDEIDSYYGEKLLRWASPSNISSSENPVIASKHVKCKTKVEALILKAEDLRSVASKCGSQWNLITDINSQHLAGDGKDSVSNTAPTSTTEEEAIRLHQGHDIILEQLVLLRETIFQRLDDQGQKLGRKLDDQGRRLADMAAILGK